jgi:hypothetical protein
LIADAHKEGAGGSRAYRVARNRDRAVAVTKPGETRRFVRDGVQILAVVGQSSLHDIDLDRVRVVIRSNSPIEGASGVQSTINVFEEVAGGKGRAA